MPDHHYSLDHSPIPSFYGYHSEGQPRDLCNIHYLCVISLSRILIAMTRSVMICRHTSLLLSTHWSSYSNWSPWPQEMLYINSTTDIQCHVLVTLDSPIFWVASGDMLSSGNMLGSGMDSGVMVTSWDMITSGCWGWGRWLGVVSTQCLQIITDLVMAIRILDKDITQR